MGAPAFRAVIQGQVQGLGFRPHVYRLAMRMGVTGTVANTPQGVVVIAQGKQARRFLGCLQREPPPLSRIASFDICPMRTRRYRRFFIAPSQTGREERGIEVLPDLATCADCRSDVLERNGRRYGYVFTNCTHCGPRYTIIQGLPYDRARTTMRQFRMCPDCQREYDDPTDRRFHAQPNACPKCGPALSVLDRSGRPVLGDPLDVAARALAQGKVVALKSLGGFQLVCDATNDQAVRRLRRRKNRPAKPLALMCDDLAVVRSLVRVGRPAAKLLSSAAAPIVLLPKLANPKPAVSTYVAPRNPRLGVMLSYTPLHMALLRSFRSLTGSPGVLVMTSANRRDEPIAVSEDCLLDQLAHVFDLVLAHNRPIANRCDDSVILGDRTHVMVRRARGYAPQPIRFSEMFHVKRPVLAVGGDNKTSFVLAHGARAFVSPHIGHLESPEAASFFLDTLARYETWTGIKPAVIACDLHPDYVSTHLAEGLAKELNAPLVRVQHHYAHVTSTMVENGVSGPVLGIACDGTGYGTDGAIWGCEFLLVRRNLSWARLGHLGYLRLSAAGAEVADPTGVARAYLSQANRVAKSAVRRFELPRGRPPGTRTSSLGRLFDAVAAITGACRDATFDGEAAVALEAMAAPNTHGDYVDDDLLDLAVSPAILHPEPLIRAVSRETRSGVHPAIVSARFHNTLAKSFARLAHRVCRNRNIRTVCLSGGSFQNSRLRTQLSSRLRSLGYQVYFNQLVPLNDGGIALGQMVAAGWTFPG